MHACMHTHTCARARAQAQKRTGPVEAPVDWNRKPTLLQMARVYIHAAAQRRSAAKRSAAKRSEAQRSAAQRSAAQRSEAKRSEAQRSAAKRSEAQRSAAQERREAQRSAQECRSAGAQRRSAGACAGAQRSAGAQRTPSCLQMRAAHTLLLTDACEGAAEGSKHHTAVHALHRSKQFLRLRLKKATQSTLLGHVGSRDNHTAVCPSPLPSPPPRQQRRRRVMVCHGSVVYVPLMCALVMCPCLCAYHVCVSVACVLVQCAHLPCVQLLCLRRSSVGFAPCGPPPRRATLPDPLRLHT